MAGNRGFISVPCTGRAVRLTFVAHATVLVEDDGKAALFDPNYSKRLAYVFNRRKAPLPIPPDKIAKPDVILVSHDHYDHLDGPSIRRYDRWTPVALPRNVKFVADLMGRRDVRPLSWWEPTKAGGFDITAVPAFHFSGRPPWLWVRNAYQGYVLQGSKTVYFAGDTGLGNDFKGIGEKFDIDVAVLPIGAYNPPSFRVHHVSPEDALEAMKRLRAKHLLPVHWGAFDLSWEPFTEPPERMARVAKNAGMEDRVHVVPPGTTIEI